MDAAPAVAAGPAPRPRVVILDPLHPWAVAALRERYDVETHVPASPDQLPELVRDAEVLVVRSGVTLTSQVLRSAPRLRVIARAGAGTDNIHLDTARRAGVVVFTVPGGSANAVAELALGSTLALARHIATGDRLLRENRWNKAALTGYELQGRTMGVVGFGAIGARVAELARGISMGVTAAVARPSAERAARLRRDGVELLALPDLLAGADVVCLAVPLTARTRGMIAEPQLRAMRRSALLVNVARGPVVAEADLIRALRDGTIAGAALDVFAEEGKPTPLAGLDNVVLTPHIGAMTEEAQARIGRSVVRSIDAALAGRPVPHRVC